MRKVQPSDLKLFVATGTEPSVEGTASAGYKAESICQQNYSVPDDIFG